MCRRATQFFGAELFSSFAHMMGLEKENQRERGEAAPNGRGIHRASGKQSQNCLWGLHGIRSEEHTSELQSQSNLVCRLLLEKKKNMTQSLASITEPLQHTIP